MNTQNSDEKKLFEYVNTATEYIRTAENIYKDFLRWSGLFINEQGDGKKYSIANQLLIYAYNNNARLVRDEKVWNGMGVSVIKKDNPICILRKTHSGYESRVVYDISSTNAQPMKIITGRDWGSKCEALISSTPCRIEFDPHLTGQRANYIHKDGVIMVGKGFKNYENIIAALSQEYAHFYVSREAEKAFDKKFVERLSTESTPKMKAVYYKFMEGKYYELSPGELIRKDSNGRLFLVDQDKEGNLYKIHVEKKMVEEPVKEIRKPEFRYSKTSYQHIAYAVSCMFSITAGIDPGVYKFSNEMWKEKSLPEIRDELDVITSSGRKILFDYNEALIRQGNAVYEDFQNKTEQVNQAESEVV